MSRLIALPFQESQPDQIRLGPLGLVLNNCLKSLPREGAASAVRRNGDAPAVGMLIALVRACLTDEGKAVPKEGGHQIFRGKRMEATIVDGHGCQTVTAMRGCSCETSST